MAIIRYPDSREELHRSVFKLKFSANSATNKVCLFSISVLVYHRYQFI